MSSHNSINYKEFENVDIRIGTVIEAYEYNELKKPSIILKIDFGEKIGIKKTSAQLKKYYKSDELIGDIVKTVEKNGAELNIKEKNTIQTSGRQIQLKRAFNNIIDNSKRYAKQIEIILYTNEKDCVIEFNDDGEGIPRDKYEDVFKPFFTLDPSRNKLKGESGLGLTITRDIIRSHGGDVKLSDSNLGGLQLKVLLPL